MSTTRTRDDTELYDLGAPHGITAAHQDEVNADLLALLQS
jgi:hypothetical protein